MYLVFDTETTGKPLDYRASIETVDNWPRIVQLAWIMFDGDGDEVCAVSRVIKPDGWTIPDEAAGIHGITTALADEQGVPIVEALSELRTFASGCNYLIAHNVGFDFPVTSAEFYRLDKSRPLESLTRVCTMMRGTNVCQIPGRYGYKWPRLEELHQHLFESVPDKQHDALADARACARCFFEMRRRGFIQLETAATGGQAS